MEFIEAIAIIGALTSILSAFISFRLTGTRLEIEEELKHEIHAQLVNQKILLNKLEAAKNKEEIKSEVSLHIKDYEEIISMVMKTMPKEKQEKVFPAISQESEKGRISYISKLLSGSITNA